MIKYSLPIKWEQTPGSKDNKPFHLYSLQVSKKQNTYFYFRINTF